MRIVVQPVRGVFPSRLVSVCPDMVPERLGVKPLRETLPPKTARLLKRLRRVEELPPADQRAVLKLVDAMLETRRRSTPPPRIRKAS